MGYEYILFLLKVDQVGLEHGSVLMAPVTLKKYYIFVTSIVLKCDAMMSLNETRNLFLHS